MASLNKVFLMGNLTRDPDLRTTPSGASVCEFGLAVNRRFTVNGNERDETCFVDITVWSKAAENCKRFLEKGSPVLVEGRLQMDTWEKDGVRHQKLKVRASAIKFLPKPDRSATDSRQPPSVFSSAPTPDVDTDDIPF